MNRRQLLSSIGLSATMSSSIVTASSSSTESTDKRHIIEWGVLGSVYNRGEATQIVEIDVPKPYTEQNGSVAVNKPGLSKGAVEKFDKRRPIAVGPEISHLPSTLFGRGQIDLLPIKITGDYRPTRAILLRGGYQTPSINLQVGAERSLSVTDENGNQSLSVPQGQEAIVELPEQSVEIETIEKNSSKVPLEDGMKPWQRSYKTNKSIKKVQAKANLLLRNRGETAIKNS